MIQALLGWSNLARHNTGRDDVAASLVLAAGATARMPKASSGIYKGMV